MRPGAERGVAFSEFSCWQETSWIMGIMGKDDPWKPAASFQVHPVLIKVLGVGLPQFWPKLHQELVMHPWAIHLDPKYFL